MGEDHEVVFVVADDMVSARRAAKAKWGGDGRAHVDALTRVHPSVPVIIAAARSDEPTPVAKRFSAPQVTVWLSAPITRSPGSTRPRSATI